MKLARQMGPKAKAPGEGATWLAWLCLGLLLCSLQGVQAVQNRVLSNRGLVRGLAGEEQPWESQHVVEARRKLAHAQTELQRATQVSRERYYRAFDLVADRTARFVEAGTESESKFVFLTLTGIGYLASGISAVNTGLGIYRNSALGTRQLVTRSYAENLGDIMKQNAKQQKIFANTLRELLVDTNKRLQETTLDMAIAILNPAANPNGIIKSQDYLTLGCRLTKGKSLDDKSLNDDVRAIMIGLNGRCDGNGKLLLKPEGSSSSATKAEEELANKIQKVLYNAVLNEEYRDFSELDGIPLDTVHGESHAHTKVCTKMPVKAREALAALSPTLDLLVAETTGFADPEDTALAFQPGDLKGQAMKPEAISKETAMLGNEVAVQSSDIVNGKLDIALTLANVQFIPVDAVAAATLAYNTYNDPTIWSYSGVISNIISLGFTLRAFGADADTEFAADFKAARDSGILNELRSSYRPISALNMCRLIAILRRQIFATVSKAQELLGAGGGAALDKGVVHGVMKMLGLAELSMREEMQQKIARTFLAKLCSALRPAFYRSAGLFEKDDGYCVASPDLKPLLDQDKAMWADLKRATAQQQPPSSSSGLRSKTVKKKASGSVIDEPLLVIDKSLVKKRKQPSKDTNDLLLPSSLSSPWSSSSSSRFQELELEAGDDSSHRDRRPRSEKAADLVTALQRQLEVAFAAKAGPETTTKLARQLSVAKEVEAEGLISRKTCVQYKGSINAEDIYDIQLATARTVADWKLVGYEAVTMPDAYARSLVKEEDLPKFALRHGDLSVDLTHNTKWFDRYYLGHVDGVSTNNREHESESRILVVLKCKGLPAIDDPKHERASHLPKEVVERRRMAPLIMSHIAMLTTPISDIVLMKRSKDFMPSKAWINKNKPYIARLKEDGAHYTDTETHAYPSESEIDLVKSGFTELRFIPRAATNIAFETAFFTTKDWHQIDSLTEYPKQTLMLSINHGRDASGYSPIFVYYSRGGTTTIQQLDLLPFHSAPKGWHGNLKDSALLQQTKRWRDSFERSRLAFYTNQEATKEAHEKKHPSRPYKYKDFQDSDALEAVSRFYSNKNADYLLAPQGCVLLDAPVPVRQIPREADKKTSSSLTAADHVSSRVLHSFHVKCPELPPHLKWTRLSGASPFEDLWASNSVAAHALMPNMWAKRRLVTAGIEQSSKTYLPHCLHTDELAAKGLIFGEGRWQDPPPALAQQSEGEQDGEQQSSVMPRLDVSALSGDRRDSVNSLLDGLGGIGKQGPTLHDVSAEPTTIFEGVVLKGPVSKKFFQLSTNFDSKRRHIIIREGPLASGGTGGPSIRWLTVSWGEVGAARPIESRALSMLDRYSKISTCSAMEASDRADGFPTRGYFDRCGRAGARGDGNGKCICIALTPPPGSPDRQDFLRLWVENQQVAEQLVTSVNGAIERLKGHNRV